MTVRSVRVTGAPAYRSDPIAMVSGPAAGSPVPLPAERAPHSGSSGTSPLACKKAAGILWKHLRLS